MKKRIFYSSFSLKAGGVLRKKEDEIVFFFFFGENRRGIFFKHNEDTSPFIEKEILSSCSFVSIEEYFLNFREIPPTQRESRSKNFLLLLFSSSSFIFFFFFFWAYCHTQASNWQEHRLTGRQQ